MIDHFNSEENALEQIRKGNILALCKVPELTQGEASKIVRNAISEEYRTKNPLKDETMKGLFKKILKKIKEKARTKYGKARLNLYFPVSSEERIREVRKWVRKTFEIKLKGNIDEDLSHVAPLEASNHTLVDDRIVLTDDLEDLNEIRETFPGLPADLVEDYRELRGYLQEYKIIFILGDEFPEVNADSESVVRSFDEIDDPVNILPEMIIDFYTRNLETIVNSIRIWRNVDSSILEDVKEDKIKKVEELISDLGKDGNVQGGGELRRLDEALRNLRNVVDRTEDDANEEIEQILDEKEITIRGSDLRTLIKSGREARDLVHTELSDEFDQVTEKSIDQIISKLELDYEEKEIAQDLFSRDLELPVKVDGKIIDQLREVLSKKYAVESLEKRAEVAQELKELMGEVRKLVERVLEIDVALAVKKFSEENKMILPELRGKGFKVKKSRNLFLENPEPIDYEVEGVRLLTGVNSGGKTTALDLVAQLYILSHMGFPVPAEEARVELLSNFYYYRNIKKTMNSGALENLLKSFETLLASDGSKLVLVDELENITEPGASAKIGSGILEILQEAEGTAIFVSHLADKIRERADAEIPVDGIEPEGLDENMNLIVNRTPKRNLLATSTPELVVKKLANRSSSKFYNRLLKKFEER